MGRSQFLCYSGRLAAASLLAVSLSVAVFSPAAEAQRRERPRAERPVTAIPEPSGPVVITISIKAQRLRVYDSTGEIASTRVSSGRPGFDTPRGVFTILEKNEHHVSNIYDAEMPFMQRLTWSGIALHAGVVPGYRASHGCIRLPYSFARSLFGATRLGARVIVTDEEEAPPQPIAHVAIFQPLPAEVATGAPSPLSRVAANGAHPSAVDTAVASLLGVTPAQATEASIGPISNGVARSRGEIDRQAAARMDGLKAALRSAERARTDAADRAKIAIRKSELADLNLRNGQRDISERRAALSRALADAERAQVNFRAFAEKVRGTLQPDRLSELEERELSLEDDVLDTAIARDDASLDAAKSEIAWAEIEAAASAERANRQAAMDGIKTNMADLRAARVALLEGQKDAARRARPVSVFVSLKDKRILVRQGLEPIVEAPIEIENGPDRFGTYVMTAAGYGLGGEGFDWRVVTAQNAPEAAVEPKVRKGRKAAIVKPVTPLKIGTLQSALDAIRIPDHVRQQITELARPGASMIISDRGLSHESSAATEFVILTN